MAAAQTPQDNARDRTILIAGGGIAGLTAALCLSRRGYCIEVYERAVAADTSGAGLQVSPNALRILDDLGLGRQLRRAATFPRGIRIHSAKSAGFLNEVPLGDSASERFSPPYLTMHRVDLHRVLLDACRAEASVTVFEGVELAEATVDADDARATAVLVCAKDGATTKRGMMLVAADGVHSAIRRQMGLPPAVHSGFVAWRAMIPADRFKAGRDLNDTHLVFGPGAHGVFYPVRDGSCVNAVFIVESASRDAKVEPHSDPALLRQALSGWHSKFATLMADGIEWTIWPILQMPKTDMAWHSGQTVLIGDAAHAMAPFSAQGAAMAIEDAEVLAAALEETGDPVSAGKLYEERRRPRINDVVRLTARNGLIYHLRPPLSLARDIALRTIDGTRLLERQAWIYDWKA